ncbi:MAG TPA: shikimate kinase [Polyangia bacterium]
MKLVVVGNSGSGKSTFAQRAAAAHGLVCLELDGIVWEPRQIAVERPREAARAELAAFIAAHARWVVEGCYGDLAAAALPACSELVFMNPGVEACLANNRRRPWEPHKYDSAADQERLLPNLLAWVEGYYTRDDVCSYAYHRRMFDTFAGAKRELREVS